MDWNWAYVSMKNYSKEQPPELKNEANIEVAKAAAHLGAT